MKRALWLLPLLMLFAALTSVSAQDATQDVVQADPLDWVPADFAAFVRIDMSAPSSTLSDLNVLLYVASVIQPNRLSYSQTLNYDALFPLNSFDMENASFANNVLTWLKGDLIIAYAKLDDAFAVEADSTVFILPTDDSFQAATAMRTVIAAQDFPQQENYDGVIVYQGDKTAFAFTPTAILVGAQPLLQATLDTMTGTGQALTADPIYQQVRAALPDDNTVLGYVGAASASGALSALTSGSVNGNPLLVALDQALSGVGDPDSAQRLLLSGAVDGIGVGVAYQRLLTTGHALAQVAVHTATPVNDSHSTFDPSVLDLIPRSAMLVQSGADVHETALMALYGLPLVDFAGELFGAFPVSSTAGAQVLPTPSAAQAQDAVTTFLDVLQPVVDLRGDLLDQLGGSYAIALLPRPNNPTPVLNTPFDLLFVAQTDNAKPADLVSQASTLLSTFTEPLADDQLDGQSFQTLRDPAAGDPVVQIGSVGDLLVIGTGTAAAQAVAAARGDNQLIKQDRWQALSPDDQIPYVYVDVNAYYDTFRPTAGGASSRQISQIGVRSHFASDQLIVLEATAVLTP